MLILGLFLVIIMIQLGQDIFDHGISIYRSPRFWTQLGTMLLIVYVTALA